MKVVKHSESEVEDYDAPYDYRPEAWDFVDFGVAGKLALIFETGAWAWVEPAISSFPSEGVIRVELLGESGTKTCGIPTDIWAVIAEYYTLDLPFDVFDDASREQAVAGAEILFNRFRDGDYRSFHVREPPHPFDALRIAGAVVKEAA